MQFTDVGKVGEGAVIFRVIQFFLLLCQLNHVLQEFVHRLLLIIHSLLQVLALLIQPLDSILNLLFALLGRDSCLDVELLVGMQADTASSGRGWYLRELVLGITAVEHDVAGLRYDLRHVADHVLAPVDTRIHSLLMDDGGAALDTTRLSDTF